RHTIAGAGVEQQRRQQASEGQRADNSQNGSSGGKGEPLMQQHLHDRLPRLAESHADAQFMRALADRQRHHAGDAGGADGSASRAKIPSRMVVVRGEATDSCCRRSIEFTWSMAICGSMEWTVERTVPAMLSGSTAVRITRRLPNP